MNLTLGQTKALNAYVTHRSRGLTVGELSRILTMAPSSTRNLISVLHEKGLITRQVPARINRDVTYVPTPHGLRTAITIRLDENERKEATP